MRGWKGVSGVATLLVLSACVTINVYFPAAEAKEAAKMFVEEVIGDKAAEQAPPEAETDSDAPADGGGMAMRIDPLMLLGIGSAHAQGMPDITLKTPAIQSIQSRMEQRFRSTLRAHFDSGALGFGNDGLVVVRDASKLGLRDRVAVKAAVADDNRDRAALYREVAVANGHPEWEGQIRGVFARQWIESAHGGWWYQTAQGQWKQK